MALYSKRRGVSKYIQPSYSVDYNTGKDAWELSAAVVLPWGRSNPDIALYRRHQAFSLANQSFQRQMIQDRLKVMLDTVDDYRALADEQDARIEPVLDRLNNDLQQMERVPLDQVRNLLSIRKQMLDASVLVIEKEWRLEGLSVDFAEELGGW
ncbi:MAG: hypothetical protein JXR40_09605 [Pontiellaceae bacterium]|nr:hypothetical protein [Pontiellaceae bacterium]